MKTNVVFKGEVRDSLGKGASRELRRQGRLPAVIYGKGQEPLAFSLDENSFVVQYNKGGATHKLMKVELDGKEHFVLPREIQVHPVSDKPEHVDFLKVEDGSRVRVNIPLRVRGAEKCVGVKLGGALNVVRHEVEMYCSPASIPSFIEVDVREMKIGESLHISQVTLPEGTTPTITDRDFTLITVAGRMKEETTATAAEGEEAAAEGGEEASAEGDAEGAKEGE